MLFGHIFEEKYTTLMEGEYNHTAPLPADVKGE